MQHRSLSLLIHTLLILCLSITKEISGLWHTSGLEVWNLFNSTALIHISNHCFAFLASKTDWFLVDEWTQTHLRVYNDGFHHLSSWSCYIHFWKADKCCRTMLLDILCFLVFMDFWVRMGKPVYLCVFKTESEMKRFEDELRWCGAGFFDKVIVAEALLAGAFPFPSLSCMMVIGF